MVGVVSISELSSIQKYLRYYDTCLAYNQLSLISGLPSTDTVGHESFELPSMAPNQDKFSKIGLRKYTFYSF